MEIGAGHVMRVSAIAEELIDRHLDVVFVGDINGLPWVNERITSMGFSAIHPSLSTFASNQESDVLILDSYIIDPGDPFVKDARWKAIIAVVDDVTPIYKADLYIHSGSGTNWTPPPGFSRAPLLSGVDYLAIRKSIREIAKLPRLTAKRALEITVVGGGSDPFGFCVAISKLLRTLGGDFRVSIFTGDKRGLQVDPRFMFLPSGPKFEENLRSTDLVFTTAGTSSWELLSLGLPIGLALAADNQAANYEYQITNNLALDIGFYSSSGKWNLQKENIEILVGNSTTRSVLHEKSSAAIDGQGVARIADSILQICLR